MDNTTSLIISLIVDSIAIFLAIYFFLKSKSAEKTTSDLLKRINLQVDKLENVADHYVIKTFDYFTKLKPLNFNDVIEFVSIIKDKPKLNETIIEKDEDTDIKVSIYFYYYSYIANYFAQTFLISTTNIEPKPETLIETAKEILDHSFETFFIMQKYVETYDNLENHKSYELFERTKNSRDVIHNYQLYQKFITSGKN